MAHVPGSPVNGVSVKAQLQQHCWEEGKRNRGKRVRAGPHSGGTHYAPFLRGLVTVGGDRASFVCQTVSASLRLSHCQTGCSLGTPWGDLPPQGCDG